MRRTIRREQTNRAWTIFQVILSFDEKKVCVKRKNLIKWIKTLLSPSLINFDVLIFFTVSFIAFEARGITFWSTRLWQTMRISFIFLIYFLIIMVEEVLVVVGFEKTFKTLSHASLSESTGTANVFYDDNLAK